MRTNYHGGEAKYRDMRTDYHGGEAKYRDMRTGYHGGEAKYRDMRAGYHGGEAKYRDMRVGFSPARDLRDLDSPSATIRAESPKAPSPGQGEQREPTPWVDHIPNDTPYRGKSKTSIIKAFALSERTSLHHRYPGRRSCGTCPGLCALCPVGARSSQPHPLLLLTTQAIWMVLKTS